MSTKEDPIVLAEEEEEEEASQKNKRARVDSISAEDPPAKMMRSSPGGGHGGPPLLPMNLERSTTAASSAPQQQQDGGGATTTKVSSSSSPSSKTRLTTPTASAQHAQAAPAAASVPLSSSSSRGTMADKNTIVGSPSRNKKNNDPPPPVPKPSTPLQPKTGTSTTANNRSGGGGTTSSNRKGGGNTTTTTTGNSGTGVVVDAKCYKGLRHFSMMVCKKVEEKGETTYNEVADELVKTVMEVRKKEDPNSKFDEKNIRRRVYDSINVLLAMDIIAKDKKQISWKGLPSTAHHDLQLLEREEESRKKQVEAKRLALKEILLQQISFRNLVTRNKEREVETLHAEKVPLPFIVVNTHREAIIHCNMAPDLTNVMFEYDRPFEINDDNSILTRLGMHKATLSTLREMVPEDMVTYCQEHGLLDSVLGESETKAPPVLGLATEGANKGQYFRSIS